MLLKELIDAFKEKYKFECFKRNVPEKIINEKFIVLLFSEVVSDIQKNFGVIQTSQSISVVSGTDKYDLTTSTMTIKDTMLGDTKLVEKSSAWMEQQTPLSATPSYYSLIYLSNKPKIWLYPNPVTADTLVVNYVANFNLYSPSSITAGDFGDFSIAHANQYTGDTVFPTQYDKLLILGMLKQIFKDIEEDYSKEKMILKARQFNGESLSKYNMTGVIK